MKEVLAPDNLKRVAEVAIFVNEEGYVYSSWI